MLTEEFTVTRDYAGITATISMQLHYLYQELGKEELEHHLADFSNTATEMGLYPIHLPGGAPLTMTIYRHEGNIHAKTSKETYLPGTPAKIVRRHVDQMRHASKGFRNNDHTLLTDLLHSIDIEEKRLESGIYDFPYEKVQAIMQQLIDFGIGPVTIGYILGTIANDDPKTMYMMGLAGIEPSFAAPGQIDQICQAATNAQVHPEVALLIRTVLETGHQSELAPTGSLKHAQAQALRQALAEAGFHADHIDEVIQELKDN